MKVPTKVTPRDKLEISRLDQLMKDDLDVDAFKLEIKKKVGIDIADRITEVTVDRTIEGASTITVDLDDSDRELLNSGRLTQKPDIQVDGLWFRMTGVTKSNDQLEITFEDREIAVLRTYTSKKVALRSKMTRAQFILSLIQEVQEFKIPWVIPELTVQQPIESQVAVPYPPFGGVGKGSGTGQAPAGGGVANDTGLRYQGSKLDASQISVINTILAVAKTNLLPRKLWVIAIMVAGTESTFRNLPLALPPAYNAGQKGVFQQNPSYWAASGDVATDAESFFLSGLPSSKWPHGADGLVKNSLANPNMDNAALAELTQKSGHSGGSNYAPNREFAERVVTDFGLAPTSLETTNAMATNDGISVGPFHFYRGEPTTVKGKTVFKPESSWKCIQRLADDVGWRAFFVSGTFYYVSEEWLFAGPPVAVVSESSEGVDNIDFDYQSNTKAASVTIDARIGRWEGVPGSVIQLLDLGPCTGRWIVSNVHRSFFDLLGTISLVKPRPKLPEPLTDPLPNFTTQPGQQTQQTQTGEVPNTACAKTIVDAAYSQLGKPYVWGAEEAGVAFDCSGLTQWAASKAGVTNLVHHAQSQWDAGPRAFGPLQPGDLVFFSTEAGGELVDHCGIYIGNNQFIHAPHTGDHVKISKFEGYYDMNTPLASGGHFVGATRPCNTIQPAPPGGTGTGGAGTSTGKFRTATVKNGVITWKDTGKDAPGDALSAWAEQHPNGTFPKEGEEWQVAV